MGSNREKLNIAIAILDKWRIWTYPISHFNDKERTSSFSAKFSNINPPHKKDRCFSLLKIINNNINNVSYLVIIYVIALS